MNINRLKLILHISIVLCIMVILGCDTENFLNLDTEILEVDLQSDSRTLNIGDTTTITAIIDYSGDSSVLVYKWTTTGGRIIGNGTSVIFVAPESSGRYTISLEVSDATVTDTYDIQIDVNIGHAITASPNRYWGGNTFTQKLVFRLNVEEIFRENITLRYEILQDTARAGAFLSIHINNTPVIHNRAIGTVQPAQELLIADDVDVSTIVSSTGSYEVTLTLEIVNMMEDSWLLRKLTFIGVEGTLSEIR